MAAHNDLGALGEEVAFRLLHSKGYEILERNWRWGKAEIDILAKFANLLVVVEVKTRRSERFGNPELGINKNKEDLLKDAVEAYLEQANLDLPIRFDIVSIILKRFQTPRIRHLEGAF